jgi:hypothetical protein
MRFLRETSIKVELSIISFGSLAMRIPSAERMRTAMFSNSFPVGPGLAGMDPSMTSTGRQHIDMLRDLTTPDEWEKPRLRVFPTVEWRRRNVTTNQPTSISNLYYKRMNGNNYTKPNDPRLPED